MNDTMTLRSQLGLGWAFVERQTNLWKRHWAWEVVWLLYGVVNTLAITFIAKQLTNTMVLMRVERGQIGLHTRVADVLPAFGLNTLAGLSLAYLGGALGANVWLLKGYFDTVPRELDEAAIVDGASHARIFFTMTLRLVMPILVTVFMLVFVGLYSEFMLASIFLTDIENQTLGVGLDGMTLGYEANAFFGRFTAGALLASIPVMVL